MKWIIAISIILILPLAGCRSTTVNTRCEALKIAEKKIPAEVASRASAVVCELDGSQGKLGTYFADFVTNNVTIAELGPGWTTDETYRELYPGDAFNLLTIRIDKDTGQVVSKVASYGFVLGHPGMLPECNP